MDLHQLASLLVRDYSIMAKRHHDLARDCRAITGTWRRVLDATQPPVPEGIQGEDGKPGAPDPLPGQDLWLFVDDRNQEVV